MRPTDNIRNSFRKLKTQTSPGLDEKIHEEISRVTVQLNKNRPAKPVLWSIIMKSKISKLATAAVIIVLLLTSFHYFGGSFENVAFADVIKIMQNSSYSFDATTVGDVDDRIKVHFAILLSVGCRIDMDDPSQGTTSSIFDFNTGDSIVLLHGNKLAITELPESENLFANGTFAMFLNPAERLWDLKDGTETQLGVKEIDGVSAIGFKVEKVKDNFMGDLVIWANRKTAAPVRVELTLHDPENSHSVTFIMTNFNLNEMLDKNLFSTTPPQGYKVTTFQKLRENPAGAYRGE
jgi:outer membrane lipoprotein-sorting protein